MGHLYRRLRSELSAFARAILVIAKAIRRDPTRPSLLVLPSQGPDDGAANLRGYLIADQLRGSGWNAITCPKQLRLWQRRLLIRAFRPDVILIQAARHPLNRPHLYRGVPVVFDLDDADYIAPHSEPAVIEALQGSRAVIAGSRAVAAYCRQHNADVSVVWTGSPIGSDAARPQSSRARIIAWGASSPVGSVHEAAFLREVVGLVLKRTSDFELWLYADDGSAAYRAMAEGFEELGAVVRTFGFLPYAEYLATLNDVAVGLAPLVDIAGFSGGKSFGKVLAYMDRRVPIVTHPVVDHPEFFKDGQTAYLATSPSQWAEHVADLLDDVSERQQIADAAFNDFSEHLGIRVSAEKVGAVLRRVLDDRTA